MTKEDKAKAIPEKGTFLLQLGCYQDAIQAHEKAIKLKPGYPGA